MMKKTISLLLSLAMLLSLLAACQPSSEETPPPTDQPSASVLPSEQPSESAPAEEEGLSCAEIMAGLLGALDMEDSPTTTYGADDEEPEQLAAYLEESYGLSEGEWVDAYVARKDKSSGLELTVVRCADEDAAAHALECLKAYRARRYDEFDPNRSSHRRERALMYAPKLLCSGEYAAMFACYGKEYAAKVFARMMETGEVPEPTGMKTSLDAQMDLMLAICEEDGDDVSNLERISSGDTDRLKSIVEEEYGLTGMPWKAAAIARGTGGSVFELAIVQFENNDAARDGLWPVANYLNTKEAEYTRFPAQAKLLNEAEDHVPISTGHLILAVCTNTRSPAFLLGDYLLDGKCMGYDGVGRHLDEKEKDPAPPPEMDPNFPDRVKFTPPNEEDMSIYDTSAIRDAWVNGDLPGLSENDRAVYSAAGEILGEILQDGMTSLEKEEAIYRWVVNNVNYDWSHMDVLSETPRAAYEPYGALVNQTAVCLGYATGFQLLCDLAEVECITIVGAGTNSTEDHAWNMVRLDEKWYCVDPTWDANNRELQGEGSEWKYFNVTSDEMAKNHQWDYANIPEATA